MQETPERDVETTRLGVRVAANTLVQAAGTVVGALIGFATFVALTRGLGPASFGDFTAAMAYLFLPVVIADVGLTAGVLREISAAPERTAQAMGAFLPLSAAVSSLVVGTLAVAGLALPFSERTKVAIGIGSIGALLTMMTLALSPVLQARLKMHWAVGATIAGRLLALALIVAAFGAGLGFTSVVAATVIGIGFTCVIQLVGVLRLVDLRPHIDTAYWRRLARGSFALGTANALGQINFRVDTVLLALFRSPTEVGYYSAAYKFVELASTTAGTVGVSVFPPLARFAATRDPRLQPLAQRTFDVLLAAAGPVAILFVFFADEIVGWTAGREFGRGAVALQLLALYIPFGFLNHLGWRLLAVFRDDRVLLAIGGGALAATIGLNLALIPAYGFKAAAVITFVVEAVAVGASALMLVRRHGFVLSLRYARTIAAAFAPAALVVVTLPAPSLARILLALACYLIVLVVAPGSVRQIAARLAESLRPALARR